MQKPDSFYLSHRSRLLRELSELDMTGVHYVSVVPDVIGDGANVYLVRECD